MLALFRFLRLSLLGFRYRLPLLPDQGYQGLTDWKLVSDGLDNVLQFIFATSKGTFFVARRNGEIERRIPDRVPWEALFQTPIFVDRQNEKVVANPVSHSHHRVNRKPGEKQAAALRLSANSPRNRCAPPSSISASRTTLFHPYLKPDTRNLKSVCLGLWVSITHCRNARPDSMNGSGPSSRANARDRRKISPGVYPELGRRGRNDNAPPFDGVYPEFSRRAQDMRCASARDQFRMS